MSTFIDGIGSSQNMDSSGEIIDIAGMDISSLDKSGTITWEHNNSVPSAVIGKILKAKKIFSEKDCENDRQKYYWNKCQVPYIYILGELFDDYNDSAREVAGMLKYDQDREGRQEVPVVGFSIEGAYLQREGGLVKRSIARKVTCTTTPCNKAAIAKLVPTKKPEDSIDSLFKTEFSFNAEACVGEALEIAKSSSDILGITKSGKTVLAKNKVSDYKEFSEEDHEEASELHKNLASKFENDLEKSKFHKNKAELHLAAKSALSKKSKKVAKTLDAGSGMAEPSELAGGAALAKESLSGSSKNMSRPNTGFGAIIHRPGPTTNPGKVTVKPPSKTYGKVIVKSEWLARAEQEYEVWAKKGEFEKFLSNKMPGLTKTEIKVIGQVFALNKALSLEKSLSEIVGYSLNKKDRIKGGLADNIPDSEFDPEALAEGIKVEMEHTNNPEIAKEVCKDHLKEDPLYYKKLKTIEKK